MSKDRYIVEYFREASDTMETLFIEAVSKDEAKQAIVDRCGAYTNIVACNLTKSSGGPGATFQPGVPVELADNDFSVPDDVETAPVAKKEPKTVVVKAPKEKKPVDVSKGDKPVKITNASRIREQVVAAKAAGSTEMQPVIDWAVANLGQSKGMAKAYVKAIFAE